LGKEVPPSPGYARGGRDENIKKRGQCSSHRGVGPLCCPNLIAKQRMGKEKAATGKRHHYGESHERTRIAEKKDGFGRNRTPLLGASPSANAKIKKRPITVGTERNRSKFSDKGHKWKWRSHAIVDNDHKQWERESSAKTTEELRRARKITKPVEPSFG